MLVCCLLEGCRKEATGLAIMWRMGSWGRSECWNNEPEVMSDCDGACTEFHFISDLVLETSTEMIVREASITSEEDLLQFCVHLLFILKCK